MWTRSSGRDWRTVVKRMLCGLALCASFACSQSPTAPSTTQSVASELRWNVMSASCAATTTPSPQPNFSAASIAHEGDGSVIASWPWTSSSGRPGLLYARFVRENGGWAMCSWDVADV